MYNVNNPNLRISPYIIYVAFINRAIVLIALAGGIIAVHFSDIVIELAARYVSRNGHLAIKAVSFLLFLITSIVFQLQLSVLWWCIMQLILSRKKK